MKDTRPVEFASLKEVRKMMKLSQFIEMLKAFAKEGEDPEVIFESYEWTDNLEELDYQPRDFETVGRQGDKIVVTLSR